MQTLPSSLYSVKVVSSLSPYIDMNTFLVPIHLFFTFAQPELLYICKGD